MIFQKEMTSYYNLTYLIANKLIEAGWVDVSPNFNDYGWILKSNGENGDVDLTFQIIPVKTYSSQAVNGYSLIRINLCRSFDETNKTFGKSNSINLFLYGLGSASTSTKVPFDINAERTEFYYNVDKNGICFYANHLGYEGVAGAYGWLGIPDETYSNFSGSRGMAVFGAVSYPNGSSMYFTDSYDELALSTSPITVNSPYGLGNEIKNSGSKFILIPQYVGVSNIIYSKIPRVLTLGNQSGFSHGDELLLDNGNKYIILYTAASNIFESSYIAIRIE